MNQKHKTLRSFYCEDALWEMFEVMTRDLDCSMDYLINEAMRHYARSRDYGAESVQRQRRPAPPAAPPIAAAAPPAYSPPPQPPQPPQQRAARPPSPPVPVRSDNRTIPLQAVNYDRNFGNAYRPTTPRIPPVPSLPAYQPPAPPAPPAPRAAPPSPSRDQWGPGAAYNPPARATLYMYFNGQRYAITKDRFVVGRGSQGTDLTIRDGNISRKHAAVIFHEGTYYVQDLGSTNGIEYQGNKVESRQISEGDLYNICDYEFRFSYQG